MNCLQLFYQRRDPGRADDRYEIESRRRSAGLRVGGAIPDETPILNSLPLELCRESAEAIDQLLAYSRRCVRLENRDPGGYSSSWAIPK